MSNRTTWLRDTATETEFQQAVVDLARTLGWRVHHTRPARTEKGWRTPIQGDPGFPDLVLARDGQVVIAELKSERGRLSVVQCRWLDELTADGSANEGMVMVWFPSDWPQIVETLKR